MSNDLKRLHRAYQLHQQGRLVDAAKIYEQLIRRDPNDYDALHLLGTIKAASGNYPEAKNLLERSLASSENTIAYTENYATILFLGQDYEKAIEICRKTIGQNSRTETLQYVLAISLYKQKCFKEAIDEFSSLLIANPRHLAGNNEKASVLAELKRYEEALSYIERALKINPNYTEALLNKGNVLGNLKKFDNSIVAYNEALTLNPNIPELHLGKGNVFEHLKRYDEAFAAYDKALAIKPDLEGAWLGRGNVFSDLKRYDEAFAAYDKALAIRPDLEGAWLGRGNVFSDLKRYDEAFAAYDKALAIKPDLEGAWLGRGNTFYNLKHYDEAFAAYDKALAIKPDLEGAWLGRGNVFSDLKRYDEAFAAYDKALAIKPDLEGAWLGCGSVFSDLKRYDEAFAAYDKALAIKPDLEGAWLGCGNVFSDLKRYDEAFAAYDKALAIKPDLEGAWLGRGNTFYNLKHYDEAFAAYDKALAIKPDLEGAWLGRGNVFSDLKRYDEAFAAYDKALTLKSDLTGVEGSRLYAKMHLCDWSNYDAECAHLISFVRSGSVNTPPFPLLAIPSSPEDQFQCAKLWSAENHFRYGRPIWQGEQYNHDRIRLGYLSADFNQHATSYLMAGLFDCHDKSRFEVTAVSVGTDDNSELLRRLKGSFEHFISAKTQSDSQVADLVRGLEIDIFIDLKGFTQDARTNVFARRPAPIQVNYLGYPGTMGAEYIDYIIADRRVIPEEQREFYSEKIVILPNSYQVNDDKRSIADKSFTRAELGLPQTGFVFCCFNNNYKITPHVFDCWMRILKQVKDSVLWLFEANSTAESNLRKEAEVRGVIGERLIFAKRMSLPDHLARHRFSDLFLDTLPYNAHTTASDALWAGLPLLTCLGETFAGRVAASLLNAICLPELITTSLEAYEQMAIDLATHPEKLENIKLKIADNRLATPLFDTKLFTKHIESAYTAMYERHQAGLAPDHIVVPN
jgi:protein O-GlcNAc transferase